MIVRFVGFAVIAWSLGFAVFTVLLPPPLLARNTTDAIVVPTGAPGRIDRGLALLGEGQARRMLVTGVGPGVRPADLANASRAPRRLFACCVDLGSDAVDTRSNAEETARWVRSREYRSVRLVTSDWHLPRAAMELRASLGPDVIVLGDGVPGNPRLGVLVNEYNKLLLRRVALWAGWS